MDRLTDSTWMERMASPLIMYFLILAAAIVIQKLSGDTLDAWHTIAGCALWVGLKTSRDTRK